LRLWCRSLVDGVHDFGVIDAAQIQGGDRQVGVTELPLDHEQWNALAGHLDRVCVPELVRREPASDAGGTGRGVQLDANAAGATWPPWGRAGQHAEQSAWRVGGS
jgi:hypothetical protein